MAKTWEGVSKAAMQILGPQGKIPPDFSSGMIKSGEASRKSWTEFKAAGKSLKEALDAHVRNAENFQGAWQAQIDDVNKDNLGIVPKKNTDDTKKIAAARKLLVGFLNDTMQENEKTLNDTKKLYAAVKIIMDAE
jgi:hypothetical protein